MLSCPRHFFVLEGNQRILTHCGKFHILNRKLGRCRFIFRLFLLLCLCIVLFFFLLFRFIIRQRVVFRKLICYLIDIGSFLRHLDFGLLFRLFLLLCLCIVLFFFLLFRFIIRQRVVFRKLICYLIDIGSFLRHLDFGLLFRLSLWFFLLFPGHFLLHRLFLILCAVLFRTVRNIIRVRFVINFL